MAGRQRRSTADQGLFDMGTVDTQPFFNSRRAAAVLKHAILAKYVVPFTAKTGSRSAGNRVVIVDGYAGPGRYDDGEPGSLAFIAEAARDKRLQGREVECLFVEQAEAHYAKLCQVLADEDSGGRVTWAAKHGNVADHLDELLSRATGVPLFLFLDPFGLGLPFDVIVNVFAGRPAGTGTPATEVLFRFDAGAIRRIRGALHAPDYPAREKQLEALDRAAGGRWWRDEDDPDLDNERYIGWFMHRLLSEITTRAKCAGWIAPVKHREDLQPAYLLVFLTRHRDGMEVFGETLSTAQEAWRRAVFDEAFVALQNGEQAALIELDPDAMFKRDEQRLAEQWQHQIEQNVRVLLREHERFVVRRKSSEVYPGLLGVARTTHLRKVLKKLHSEGVTSSDSVAKDLYGKEVVRASGAQP